MNIECRTVTTASRVRELNIQKGDWSVCADRSIHVPTTNTRKTHGSCTVDNVI